MNVGRTRELVPRENDINDIGRGRHICTFADVHRRPLRKKENKEQTLALSISELHHLFPSAAFHSTLPQFPAKFSSAGQRGIFGGKTADSSESPELGIVAVGR